MRGALALLIFKPVGQKSEEDSGKDFDPLEFPRCQHETREPYYGHLAEAVENFWTRVGPFVIDFLVINSSVNKHERVALSSLKSKCFESGRLHFTEWSFLREFCLQILRKK